MANAAASRRLADADTHGPTLGDAGDQTAFAATLGRTAGTLEGVHNGRGAPAADRLRVYRNNVIVSLSEALRTAYPTTERLVGEDFFHNASVAYAMTHKPRSPLMFEYGDTFADFLASLPGVKAFPFVPEAARIERARIDATHAADVAPLAPEALAAVPPDALAGLSFAAHPAARLVPCPNGGIGAWAANQTPERDLAGVTALISRPHDAVMVNGLDAPAAALATALLGGRPLGEAAAECSEGLDLAGTLALLIGAGAFCTVCPGPQAADGGEMAP